MDLELSTPELEGVCQAPPQSDRSRSFHGHESVARHVTTYRSEQLAALRARERLDLRVGAQVADQRLVAREQAQTPVALERLHARLAQRGRRRALALRAGRLGHIVEESICNTHGDSSTTVLEMTTHLYIHYIIASSPQSLSLLKVPEIQLDGEFGFLTATGIHTATVGRGNYRQVKKMLSTTRR